VAPEGPTGHLPRLRSQGKDASNWITANFGVDATGDADVAYLAGVPFDFGRSSDHIAQPATLKFKMNGVDIDSLKRYISENPADFRIGPRGVAGLINEKLLSVCGFFDTIRAARASGELDVARDMVLFFNTPYPDEVVVNMTRVTGITEVSSAALTAAEILSRQQAHILADFMIRRLPGFGQARLAATGTQIGLRESRRIQGLYTLTAEDVLSARQFADGIAQNAYPIDIHSPDSDTVVTMQIPDGKSYMIPLGVMLNSQVDNLVVTGRAISATHEAHASTRLSPVCMALGQAAGTVAALAARRNVALTAVPITNIQRQLIAAGADLGDIGRSLA